MAKIELWFPTIIYSEEDLFSNSTNERWANSLFEIEKTVKSGGDDWEGKTYTTHTTYELASDNTFNSLIETITHHVNGLAAQYGSTAKYKVDGSWANIARQGNYQEYHTHDGSVFSAVYYVKVPEGSGNIIFEDPRMPDMLPVKNIPERNSLSFNKIGYTPAEGTLLIFRSSLRHCVQEGTNVDPRISISMNFGYE